jgi:diguanylate cyclase (GGDEF)-like protein
MKGESEIKDVWPILQSRAIQDLREPSQKQVEQILAGAAARGTLNSGGTSQAVFQELVACNSRIIQRVQGELFDVVKKANRGVIPADGESLLVQMMDEMISGFGQGLEARVEQERFIFPSTKSHFKEEAQRITLGLRARAKQEILLEIRVGAMTPELRPPKETPHEGPDDRDDMVPSVLRQSAFTRDQVGLQKDVAAAGLPFSLIMIDGDEFKAINDNHGHDVGDAAIKGLGSLIAKRATKRGRAYRFGGDEFAILLENYSDQEALLFATLLGEEIAASDLDGVPVRMTVSIGVATALDDDSESLFRRADAALRRAKSGGKNRTEMG